MDERNSIVPTCDSRSGHRALRRGRVSLSYSIYLVTATTLGRQAFFRHFSAACSASRCFADRALLGDSQMLAWVLMPDHAHWLLQLGRQESLSDLVSRLKSASARHANRQLGRSGGLWAPAFYDQGLRHEHNLQNMARYIVANPLRAGLVRRIGDYPFWDAVWL